MDAERDYLANFLFPELEETLRDHREDLIPIDLRWGVETLAVAEREAKELLVLKVCLAEIDRSRPFFVALLGDRYGWIPPPDRLHTAAREAGLSGLHDGKSVTALEIEFGALADGDQRDRCFFFLREPLPYGEMSPEVASRYSDECSPDPEVVRGHERLVQLKARIASELPGRVWQYTAGWDGARVTGLNRPGGFGDLVREHLGAALLEEAESRRVLGPRTWQEEERAAWDDLVVERGRDFVGRRPLLDRLEALATSMDSGVALGVCILGEPGAGKSALLAALDGKLEAHTDLFVLAHSAGMSARAGSVETLLRRWIGDLARHLGSSDPSERITSRADLEAAFSGSLHRAAAGGRVVIVLDALDQFENTPSARRLSWLPDKLPVNVRVIATAQPGPQADALAACPGVEVIELAPLAEDEAWQLAERVGARYRRTLGAHVVDALVAKRTEEGTPASGNPLWLHMAIEQLLLLDEDDFAQLSAFEGSPEEQLNALLLATVAGFPATVPLLYRSVFDRAEQVYGQDLARAFSEILAVSRVGLRESDLRALLPAVTHRDWTDEDGLRFAALRRGLRGHVTQRGVAGQWDFTHAQARRAVLEGTLADADERRRRHAAVARHLFGLPSGDPVRSSELMVHLIGTDARLGAAAYYGSGLTGDDLDNATDALAGLIVAGSGTQPNPGVQWVRSLLTVDAQNDELANALCFTFCTHLSAALEGCASVDDQIMLFAGVQDAILDLVRRTQWELPALHYQLCLVHLGDLHRESGSLTHALAFYERALELSDAGLRPYRASLERSAASRSRARDIDDADLAPAVHWGFHLLTACERLGNLARQEGDRAAARDYYQSARTMAEALHAVTPGAFADPLAAMCLAEGDLARETGDLTLAADAYQRAGSLAEELLRDHPGDPRNAHLLARVLIATGDLHLARRDVPSARAAFEQAARHTAALLRQMPESGDYATTNAIAQERLGDVEAREHDWAGATDAHQHALGFAEALSLRTPDSAAVKRHLVIGNMKMAALEEAQGHLDLAEEHYLKARALAEELADEMPDSAEAASDLITIEMKLGDLQGRRNRA